MPLGERVILILRNWHPNLRKVIFANFCPFTRVDPISAGSPTHNSKPNSASRRSNPREYPVDFPAYAFADFSLLQVSIESRGPDAS